MNKKTKIIVLVATVVLVLAALVAAWVAFGPQTTKGEKAITIEVIGKDGKSTVYELNTDAEYLRGALEETEGLTFADTDGYVNTINGVTADYSVDASYWAIYVNGEYGNYGINEQPVADGDAFKFEYTVYVAE